MTKHALSDERARELAIEALSVLADPRKGVQLEVENSVTEAIHLAADEAVGNFIKAQAENYHGNVYVAAALVKELDITKTKLKLSDQAAAKVRVAEARWFVSRIPNLKSYRKLRENVRKRLAHLRAEAERKTHELETRS